MLLVYWKCNNIQILKECSKKRKKIRKEKESHFIDSIQYEFSNKIDDFFQRLIMNNKRVYNSLFLRSVKFYAILVLNKRINALFEWH